MRQARRRSQTPLHEKNAFPQSETGGGPVKRLVVRVLGARVLVSRVQPVRARPSVFLGCDHGGGVVSDASWLKGR